MMGTQTRLLPDKRKKSLTAGVNKYNPTIPSSHKAEDKGTKAPSRRDLHRQEVALKKKGY